MVKDFVQLLKVVNPYVYQILVDKGVVKLNCKDVCHKTSRVIFKNGRITTRYDNRLIPSDSESKDKAVLTVPCLKKDFKMTMNSWVAIIYLIATKLYDADTPRAKFRKFLANHFDYKSKLLDKESIVELAHKKLVKDRRTKTKGLDEVQYIQGLVKAFNDPEQYGCYALASFDMAAQNVTIYLGILMQHRDHLWKVNIHQEGDWRDIAPIDPHEVNFEKFKEFYKDKLTEEELNAVTREFIKYSIMTGLYGAGIDTMFEKAISESEESKRMILTRIANKIKDSYPDFLNYVFPGFARYHRLFVKILTSSTKNIYMHKILGIQFPSGDFRRWIHIQGTQNRRYYHTEYVTRNRFTWRQYYMELYMKDYEWDFEWQKRHDKITEEQLKPVKRYELFKMAFTTHYIDAALVRTVIRVMKNVYGVQMSSNHDNYLVHPEYMFQTVNVYINAFKMLMMESDKLLHDILNEWGAVDKLIRKLEKHTDRLSDDEIDTIPNVNMINMVLA